MGHVHYGMMMIARAAAAVGAITGVMVATRPGTGATRGVRVRNPVHERWKTLGFLCVTRKFWGEPCELKNSP